MIKKSLFIIIILSVIVGGEYFFNIISGLVSLVVSINEKFIINIPLDLRIFLSLIMFLIIYGLYNTLKS